MIRHAPETVLFPVDPLPVPVIVPSFRACPGVSGWHAASAGVSSGGGTYPRSTPAPGSSSRKCETPSCIPNLGKPTRAKPLGPSHPPHDSIAACEPERVGGDALMSCLKVYETRQAEWDEV